MPIVKRGKKWYIDYYNESNERIRKAVSEDRSLAKEALADAILRVERIKAGLETPSILQQSKLSVFYDRIVQHISLRKTRRTYETYLLHLNNFFKFLKITECKLVNDISVNIIDDYISHRLRNNISSNTVNHEIDSMRCLFNIAGRLNLVDRNPFRGIDRPAKTKKPPYFFSNDDIEKLFKFITDRFKPFFYTLLYTGVRVGELVLFEWDEFNFDMKTINIRKKESRTEAKARPRSLPFHDKVMWAVQERKKLNEHDQLVFTTMDGNIFEVSRLRNFLKRAMKKAGLKKGNLHTFRHAFASHLVSNGVDLYRVKDYLGHKSIIQTEIYAHLQPAPNKTILDENLKFDI